MRDSFAREVACGRDNEGNIVAERRPVFRSSIAAGHRTAIECCLCLPTDADGPNA